jgi:hypothetical protein
LMVWKRKYRSFNPNKNLASCTMEFQHSTVMSSQGCGRTEHVSHWRLYFLCTVTAI